MKYEIITEETIKALVDAFYARVRKNPQLGPLFKAAIGATDEAWQLHLNRLYDFWSSVMLGSGRYQGRPVPKHAALLPFEKTLFDVWLQLFEETAYSLFVNDIADHFTNKSRRIAESLKAVLFSSKF